MIKRRKSRLLQVLFSTEKDVVSGTNSYSGKSGDEEPTILLIDREGVAHFKKSIEEMAEDT